ncbi:MAG TPA: hypothetical protein VMB26_06900 [Candidatus Binataceae bacterium]|nr:hypothetical protein [Candidatus Binataceae bacterium]
MPRPCIVIPGIQGSGLENFYPVSPATTWSTMAIAETKFVAPDFNSLALDSSGLSDLDAEVVSRASQLLAIAYAPLISGLRGRLQAPVYLFPYDWRTSIMDSAEALMAYVKRLTRKAMVKDWDQNFDFAVHSMGGLVLRAFLSVWEKSNQGPPPIGQIVFIATPHLGSLEAAQSLISGESPIFGGLKELRKLARTFPSVYELLPRFPNAVKQGGSELDLFNEHNWQTNTTTADPDRDGYDVRQQHLTAAKEVLTNLPLPTKSVAANNLLIVYGAKPDSTLLEVQVGPDPAKWYDFDHAVRGEGDDVVPVESALLAGIASVELRPEDISYIRHPIERTYAATDMHAFLPALDEVGSIVAGFLKGSRGTKLLPLGIPPERFHPA